MRSPSACSVVLAAAVLFVLLHSPAARATPLGSVPEGLRGCVVSPETSPDGWAVMCSGAIIGIADGPVDGTCRTEQCVEEVVSNFKNAVGGKRHEASLTLAGVPRRVIQLDGALLGEKRIRVIIAVLDRSEGRRVLICVGTPEHEARCHAAFEAMSTLVWRAGVPSFFKSKQH